MMALEFADHFAGCDVQGGKQGHRAVAAILMRERFGHAVSERLRWLRAIHRLHLTLLVDAQNQVSLRLIETQPNDIGNLFDRMWISR